jgi:adenosylcobinamide-phosphate synthase
MPVERSSQGSGADGKARRAAPRSPPCPRLSAATASRSSSRMDLVTTLPLAALAVAFEAWLGYPQGLYRAIGHPVTWIGHLLDACEVWLNRAHRRFAWRRLCGFIALGLVLSTVAGAGGFLVEASAGLPSPAGLLSTALLASSLLAQRSLHGHVRAVAVALADDSLAAGREAVGEIVGRDVGKLDEAGVCRAAIESLAENFSDAVVAPACWLALLGLPGGACYKAINTADSMIGHKSERYFAFGFAAAKLDDLANFVPARLSALLVVAAAFLVSGATPRGAWRTALKDSRGHPSPNAGWPEAAFAGALGLRLGGPRSYGQTTIADAWIGAGREPKPRDIYRALALYRAACLLHGVFLSAAAFLVIALW